MRFENVGLGNMVTIVLAFMSFTQLLCLSTKVIHAFKLPFLEMLKPRGKEKMQVSCRESEYPPSKLLAISQIPMSHGPCTIQAAPLSVIFSKSFFVTL